MQINSLRGNAVSKVSPTIRRGGVSEGGVPRWAVMMTLLFLALGLVWATEQTHNPPPRSLSDLEAMLPPSKGRRGKRSSLPAFTADQSDTERSQILEVCFLLKRLALDCQTQRKIYKTY